MKEAAETISSWPAYNQKGAGEANPTPAGSSMRGNGLESRIPAALFMDLSYYRVTRPLPRDGVLRPFAGCDLFHRRNVSLRRA